MTNHNVPEGGTGRDVHKRDWVCLDCGITYCYDEDANRHDLPSFCPDCGDTPGWINRGTGRKI